MPSSLGALGVRLLALAAEAGPNGLIHVAASDRRAVELTRIVRALDPGREVRLFPAWDSLPFDRTPPSRSCVGRRLGVLARLAAGGRPLLVTTPDALMQRLPAPEELPSEGLTLRPGDPFDLEALEEQLQTLGYVLDERVDEAGEAALRGGVAEVFPGDASGPVRIDHAEGRVLGMAAYDPLSQRSLHPVERLDCPPVVEPDAWSATLFALMPDATIILEPKAEARRAAFYELVLEGARARFPGEPEARAATRYLDARAWADALSGQPLIALAETAAAPSPFAVATESRPGPALAARLRRWLENPDRRLVLTGETPALDRLRQTVERSLKEKAEPVPGWPAALAAPSRLSLFAAPVTEGFVDEASGTGVVAAADLLGSRARTTGGAEPALPLGEVAWRFGDAVVHLDHGLARLDGLEPLRPGGPEAVRLAFARDATLLVPTDQLDRVFRYGADAEEVTLDRLSAEGAAAWAARRAEVEAAIRDEAATLVERARDREGRTAPVLEPPRAPYERFVARFPFSETPDQAAAIQAVLADLAAGRPMDRLVCGDVGFGKTEVALRAMAAAALAGKQVALVAPTTVLVRQHVETLRRRFEGFGLRIGHLSRLVPPEEARRVKAGLADGSVAIAVGTHALAGRGVRFADLGLVVIDEEQRFGAAEKARLAALAGDAHRLTLTATPIPRTLQAALSGLQDLSVITTPPAERRPIATRVLPFDQAVVRAALIREHRRGGQSFVVVPRIEEIEGIARRLRDLVPELRPVIVHGDLPPTETDEAMVAFARGEGDILIATSLIESGLDVPRANTMLITRADRFGLAQLHQLRGRVGRGRARGFALLFTDPEHPPSAATLKRLETLSTLDRLGAGFEISARDLDQRGAGDLFGEEQAGHLKLIGVGLHRRLLRRALAETRGGAPVPELPALSLGDEGAIPAALVPEAALRLGLYVRLARLESVAEVGAFAAEFEDRFGRQPPAVRRLIAAASLRLAARDAGLAEVEAGPQAVALTFHDRSRAQAALAALIARSEGKLDWRGERLVFERPTKTPAERRRVLAKLIAAVTRATARSAPGRARREARAGAPPRPLGGPPDRGRS